MTITVVNPATGETIKTYKELTPAAARDIIALAHDAFLDWKHTPFVERGRLMRRAAHILRERASEYAVLMAQEMSKSVKDGRAEAEKCA